MAARLADGGVRELSRRPPEILLRGARVSQEVKCLSVGHRRGGRVREQPQGAVGTDRVDLGEIDPGQVVERAADLEARLVVPWLLPGARRGHRAPRRWRLGRQREGGLDGGIAGRQLRLIGVEQREVLVQHEDVLRTVVPGEGRGDLGLRRLTPVVPMLREGVGIGLARDDVPENA